MEALFNTLIDTFIDNHVGIAPHFLSKELAGHLRGNLERLYAKRQLKQAGTGNEVHAAINPSVRGDQIYWLDRAHDDPHENRFFLLMDAFVAHLNRTCYTGITGYEFHYTLYEEGRFYKKHVDQFRNHEGRKYSMILYLNVDWAEQDGGELCIYHADHLQHISPQDGKGVFFDSAALAHEVLPTQKARMSITGWLKKG
ncbi:MAG TPA: 2OG-Fe(II) oxygenase [Flavipsychrobacter sp.]|nr:2OG-Fe(II) oxygenase [Flavipsychrobacter sp.]